jgi:uncharacterized membrane protein YphA (DoxX/SURF4 family)
LENRTAFGSLLHSSAVAARLGLGALLVWAGLAKSANPFALITIVYNYEILSPPYGTVVAMFLPIAEITIGAALLAGIMVRGAVVWATVMFVTFLGAQGFVLIRKLTVSCNCFGDSGRVISGVTFARTLALTMLSGIILLDALQQRRPDATGSIR